MENSDYTINEIVTANGTNYYAITRPGSVNNLGNPLPTFSNTDFYSGLNEAIQPIWLSGTSTLRAGGGLISIGHITNGELSNEIIITGNERDNLGALYTPAN